LFNLNIRQSFSLPCQTSMQSRADFNYSLLLLFHSK
jgi:hypothetical protein